VYYNVAGVPAAQAANTSDALSAPATQLSFRSLLTQNGMDLDTVNVVSTREGGIVLPPAPSPARSEEDGSEGGGSGGISGGAIGGIVAGVVVVLLLAAVASYCCWRRRRASRVAGDGASSKSTMTSRSTAKLTGKSIEAYHNQSLVDDAASGKTTFPAAAATKVELEPAQRAPSNANSVPWSEVTDLQSASVINGPQLNSIILQQMAAERNSRRMDHPGDTQPDAEHIFVPSMEDIIEASRRLEGRGS
jgi:hypothetical protein